MNSATESNCAKAPGEFVPIIDPSRCEGKADCARVCPYDVFEIRTIDDDTRRGLPVLTRLKIWIHGNRQAVAVRSDDCRACGLCVTACPEDAITLVRAGTAPTATDA